MPRPEAGPEWVISNNPPKANLRPLHTDDDDKLIVVARLMWPRVQAYALREVGNGPCDEVMAIATEVWEGVLRSVSKTIDRGKRKGSGIKDLEAYLFGAFQHRFNRALKKERIRQETFRLFPSNCVLEEFREAQDSKSAFDIERSIQIKEAIARMDDWTRRVWAARQYGFSWSEIGEFMGLSEHKAKLRFRYAISRIRARFNSG
jgi:DNA-directed RNA polymerase specialized sigma24 family protein